MSNLPSEATNPTIDLRSDEHDGLNAARTPKILERADYVEPASVPSPAAAIWRTLRLELAKPGFLIFLAGHSVLGLLFFLMPQIDLGFSRLFYSAENGFDLFDTHSSSKLLPFIPWLITAFVNFAVLLLIRNRLALRRNPQATHLRDWNRRVIFVLLTLALGPGLLINFVLKHQSGRARPQNTQYFGGDKTFSAAFASTSQCLSNCSFVSGDAAVGYYLMAFLFIARKRRRAIALTGFAAGSAIGLIRISQGKHFLSDVIFAEFFTMLVAWILYLAILRSWENSHPRLAPNAAG